jgi:hypothetical protein
MPFVVAGGYKAVSLSKSGKTKIFKIHKLVAIAFVPNPDCKKTVNHINEDKLDNRASNLEWLTLVENLQHGTRTERSLEGIMLSWGVPVVQILLDGHTAVREYNTITDAANSVGAKPQSIWRCINGYQKTSHGYIWRSIYSITEEDLLFWVETGKRVSVPKKPEKEN